MTDTPEQFDPQEQYLQEQRDAAAAPPAVPYTRPRQVIPNPLPALTEAEALDRIAAALHKVGPDGLTPIEREVAEVIAQTGRQPEEVAARLAQPSRLDRFHGVADDYDTGHHTVAPYEGSSPPRYVLAERDASGAAGLSLHDTPEAAADYHHGHSPEEWTIIELVDLDTGSRMTVAETRTAVTWGEGS